jgi:hypothetical protein
MAERLVLLPTRELGMGAEEEVQPTTKCLLETNFNFTQVVDVIMSLVCIVLLNNQLYVCL